MEALLNEAHEVVAQDRLELLGRECGGLGDLLIALARNPVCASVPLCHRLTPLFFTPNCLKKFCMISWSCVDRTSALLSFTCAGWKRSSRLKRKAPALTLPLIANSRYLCRMASAADIEVRRPRSMTVI